MADLAMCRGNDCPLRDKCHRYTAIPCKFQYYIDAPYDHQKMVCEIFWNNRKKKKAMTFNEALEQLTKEAQEMGLYD